MQRLRNTENNYHHYFFLDFLLLFLFFNHYGEYIYDDPVSSDLLFEDGGVIN